jgi:hypothetical protein
MLSNILKVKPATKQKPVIERLNEIINMGMADEEALNRILSEKYGLPTLDSQTIQDILDIYDIADSGNVEDIKNAIIKESGFTGDKADKLRKQLGDLGTEKYRSIALAQIAKRFADMQKVTGAQKASTIQAMAHLLNFVTPARNVVSNSAMTVLEKVSESISHTIFRKSTTVGLGYSDTAKAKAKQEAKQANVDIMLGIDSRGAERGKYELNRGVTFKKGILSEAEKLMSKTLRVPDVYYKELRKQDAIERLTQLNGGVETDQIREQAEYESAYATYMDNSLPAQILQGAKNVLNIAGVGKASEGKIKTHEFGLGDLVIKYARVPGNIMARTVEYSPAGYLKMFYNMAMANSIDAKGKISQREIALSFGRATTGTGLMAIGALLSSLGLFVQREPDEEKAESALSRAAGLSQGQLNISAVGRLITGGDTKAKDGDRLVTISFLEPFATMVTAGASVYQALSEGKTAKETAEITAANTVEEILDMPTMSIIQAMSSEAYREGSNAFTILAVPLVKAIPGFVPQPVRSIAKSVDPIQRSTTGNVFQKGAKELMRNIPGAGKILEPQVKPTGEEYKNLRGDPMENIVNYMFNPGYASIYEEIPYREQLRKLSKAVPESAIWPMYYAPSSMQLDDKKGNESLTDSEKTLYMKTVGEYVNKKYTELLKNKDVDKLSQSGKENLIKELEKIKSEGRAKAKEAIKKQRKSGK